MELVLSNPRRCSRATRPSFNTPLSTQGSDLNVERVAEGVVARPNSRGVC